MDGPNDSTRRGLASAGKLYPQGALRSRSTENWLWMGLNSPTWFEVSFWDIDSQRHIMTLIGCTRAAISGRVSVMSAEHEKSTTRALLAPTLRTRLRGSSWLRKSFLGCASQGVVPTSSITGRFGAPLARPLGYAGNFAVCSGRFARGVGNSSPGCCSKGAPRNSNGRHMPIQDPWRVERVNQVGTIASAVCTPNRGDSTGPRKTLSTASPWVLLERRTQNSNGRHTPIQDAQRRLRQLRKKGAHGRLGLARSFPAGMATGGDRADERSKKPTVSQGGSWDARTPGKRDPNCVLSAGTSRRRDRAERRSFNVGGHEKSTAVAFRGRRTPPTGVVTRTNQLPLDGPGWQWIRHCLLTDGERRSKHNPYGKNPQV